jgi:phage terminase large subunit
MIELSNYVWDTKDGKLVNKPIDDYNHLMDALRYAIEIIRKPKPKKQREKRQLLF